MKKSVFLVVGFKATKSKKKPCIVEVLMTFTTRERALSYVVNNRCELLECYLCIKIYESNLLYIF